MVLIEDSPNRELVRVVGTHACSRRELAELTPVVRVSSAELTPGMGVSH